MKGVTSPVINGLPNGSPPVACQRLYRQVLRTLINLKNPDFEVSLKAASLFEDFADATRDEEFASACELFALRCRSGSGVRDVERERLLLQSDIWEMEAA